MNNTTTAIKLKKVRDYCLNIHPTNCNSFRTIPSKTDLVVFALTTRLKIRKRKQLKETQDLISTLVEAVSSRMPEDWLFINNLLDKILSQITKSNDAIQLCDEIFHQMRWTHKTRRSALYDRFDEEFLHSSLTSLSYMTELDESDCDN